MSKSNDTGSFTNTLWKFFSSVKLSVAILLSIAATSIIGTVVPQNANPAAYQEHYGKLLYTFFDSLDIFDMYHAWWFQFMLCLLTINIIVCSINRLSSTWKIIFPKTPKFNINQFRKSGSPQLWDSDITADKLKNKYEPYLSKRFSNCRTDATEDGFLIFAEKGRWCRLGVYAIHFSFLLLVIGSLIGSLFGFDGYVNIAEGESTNQVILRNNGMDKELDFIIRCDDFNVTYYDTGVPKEYRSSLSILSGGQLVKQKELIVNDPLRFQGINIFQSSYGTIPEERFTVIFTEKDTGIKYKKQAIFGEPVEIPEKKGSLVFENFRKSYPFKGVTIENAVIGRLITEKGDHQHLIIPMNYPNFDRMRGGNFVISVSDLGFKYFTGLQVTKDPGVPVVYTGFILMIIGCYITFFMFHQKICIELTEKDSLTSVSVYGVSGKNRPGMTTKTRRLANHLKSIS